MGLFDSVIGAFGPSQGGSTGGLGGLTDLLAKMQHSGLGDMASSWVGTGADQLGRVLDGDTVSSMASQLGTPPGDLLGQLSQLLPQMVGKLTPQGRVPQGGDLGELLNKRRGTRTGKPPLSQRRCARSPGRCARRPPLGKTARWRCRPR